MIGCLKFFDCDCIFLIVTLAAIKSSCTSSHQKHPFEKNSLPEVCQKKRRFEESIVRSSAKTTKKMSQSVFYCSEYVERIWQL